MTGKIGQRLIATLKPLEKVYEVCDEDLAGFLLVVRPNGRMNYYYSYRPKNGGLRTKMLIGSTSSFTPAQARERAQEISRDVSAGKDPQRDRSATLSPSSIPTLKAFLADPYGPWMKASRTTGKEAVNRIESRFESFLEKPINEIKPGEIDKWRAERLKGNVDKKIKPVSPLTINRDLIALKSALSKAKEWEVIAVHPLAGLKPIKFDEADRVRYLNPDEEVRLREQLDIHEEKLRTLHQQINTAQLGKDIKILRPTDSNLFMDHLKPMVLTAMNTGLRRGELFKIKFEFVDLERKMLTILKQISKSKKTRHVPLNDEAFAVLKKWKNQSPNATGLVFPSAQGKPFTSIKTAWNKVIGHTKVEDFHFHDLRHHFASRLVMAGVDLNTVRELLGHADIKMTLRYAHLSPEVKAQAVAKLNVARVLPIKSDEQAPMVQQA